MARALALLLLPLLACAEVDTAGGDEAEDEASLLQVSLLQRDLSVARGPAALAGHGLLESGAARSDERESASLNTSSGDLQNATVATASASLAHSTEEREKEKAAPAANKTWSLAPRALKVVQGLNATGSLDCIENNGGSCVVENCYDWRGQQTCHLGRCFCSDGMCAGADGACHRQRNAMVASGIRLRNVRFPDYYLYLSKYNNGVWVGKTPGSQANFELRLLPANEHAGTPPDFMLTSSQFPGWAVNVQACHGDNCGSSVQSGVEHITWPMDTGIQNLALNLERVPEHPDQVMIASFQYPRSHLYVPQSGWSVSAFNDDPGQGGYWTFEPALPSEVMDSLAFYHGPRCHYQCSGPWWR